MSTDNHYRHWKIDTDEYAIVWLGLDMAESRVNLLNSDVIRELGVLLDQLMQDLPQGIVIHSCKQDSFIYGADISEFTTLENEAQAQAFLQRGHALMNKLEAIACPSVSMIHGICLGGGTELSLACNYRVMSDEKASRIGLPEIKLGIHPGYGGTLRSIQRMGPLAAMDMMLTGRNLTAYAAGKTGLVDAVVPLRQLKQAARDYLLNAPKPGKPRLVQALMNHALLRPVVAAQMRKQLARKASKKHYPAPYALVELWQKYGGQPQRMLEEEVRSVAKLATSETARNLVRVFFLQETLKRQGKKTNYKPQHIHLIGGGIMGGDIASWCAIQGYSVSVQDQDPQRLAATGKRAYASFKKKYRRDRRAITAAADRLVLDHRGAGISRADLVIEAIFEDAEVKCTLYREIEPRMKPDAVLATNTSSIMLEQLSDCLQQPGRLVGLHFFNPVALMPLVEIIRGEQTDDAVMLKASSFARSIGKLPLPVKSSPGFLVNRILMPYLLEAVTMIGEGLPAEAIDKAATNFGMPMGPIELADTVGLDICNKVAQILSKAMNVALPANLENMVASGKLGKKSGAGFYQYRNGKAVKNSRASDAGMQEIEDRLVMRLLNETVACLREAIVENDEMIDAGVIFGTGFAPFTGGPVSLIRHAGVEKMLDTLKRLEQKHGERFAPDTAWSELAGDSG